MERIRPLLVISHGEKKTTTVGLGSCESLGNSISWRMTLSKEVASSRLRQMMLLFVVAAVYYALKKNMSREWRSYLRDGLVFHGS
jgi:hypothetical protein